ncbi:MAG: septum formation protein Maf, partial [Deltaproteobacteria bacterium]|nr:septum formation protein Maf [Deltaproteobacteria bacterium]
MNLILASTSPRRIEILNLLQIPFEVVSPRYEEEILPDATGFEETLRFAQEKAHSIASLYPNHLILASDTLIEFEGEKIGKPKDPKEAFEILKKLRGSTHDVISGVYLYNTQNLNFYRHVEITQINMRYYSENEIENYIETRESLDKAGAYALQGEGRKLIESLSGDYLSAVGLPLRWVANVLMKES